MKSLLMMASFWDPYCPPLGICSLQASMKHRGHDVAVFDFNTDARIWRAHRAYFDALVEVVPDAREWNILRLGPDYFARHQMAWLRLRDEPRRYREIARLILDIDGRQDIDTTDGTADIRRGGSGCTAAPQQAFRIRRRTPEASAHAGPRLGRRPPVLPPRRALQGPAAAAAAAGPA